VEDKLNELSQTVGQLKQEQERLLQKSDGSEHEQQYKLNERIEQFNAEYKSLLKQNDALKKPMKLESLEQERSRMEELSEQMEQNESQSGQEFQARQKQMKQQLQQTEDKLQQNEASLESNSVEMNMDDLQQLLDNLIWFSHQQEGLIARTNSLSSNDPSVYQVFDKQRDLIRFFDLISDSLYSLAERSPAINRSVFEALTQIRRNKDVITLNFEDRNTADITSAQRRVMMHTNDLALQLDEIQDNMQQGSGKGGKPSKPQQQMGAMREQQQKLKEQLQNMLQQMKDGKMSEKELAKKLSEMYGRQELMQSQLQQMMKQSLTPGERQKMNAINQMLEDLNRALINKKVGQELLSRQQQILDKMLDMETSLNKKEEEEEKREATESRTQPDPSKANYRDKKRPTFRINELQKGSLRLKPYYDSFFNTYLQQL
jgi:myosin heavy subunit